MQLTGRPGRKGDRSSETFAWYVGIDWGSEEHRLCVLDASGQVCGERTVAHTVAAVHEALQWVRTSTGAAADAIAVGIETPRGALVDTVLEQGFRVFAVNPKQLDRFRDRFTAAGAKDDRRDARVVADALRTDPRAFRAVRPEDPQVIQLRELCRMVEELQVEEARLANKLREQLYRVNAPWLTLSPAADEPWLWTILAETPDPAAWRQLPRRRISPALRAHRIRRLTAEDIVTALAAADADGGARRARGRGDAHRVAGPATAARASAADDGCPPDRSALGNARRGGARRWRAARAS